MTYKGNVKVAEREPREDKIGSLCCQSVSSVSVFARLTIQQFQMQEQLSCERMPALSSARMRFPWTWLTMSGKGSQSGQLSVWPRRKSHSAICFSLVSASTSPGDHCPSPLRDQFRHLGGVSAGEGKKVVSLTVSGTSVIAYADLT